jgi:hypothetical protein
MVGGGGPKQRRESRAADGWEVGEPKDCLVKGAKSLPFQRLDEVAHASGRCQDPKIDLRNALRILNFKSYDAMARAPQRHLRHIHRAAHGGGGRQKVEAQIDSDGKGGCRRKLGRIEREGGGGKIAAEVGGGPNGRQGERAVADSAREKANGGGEGVEAFGEGRGFWRGNAAGGHARGGGFEADGAAKRCGDADGAADVSPDAEGRSEGSDERTLPPAAATTGGGVITQIIKSARPPPPTAHPPPPHHVLATS